MKAPVWLRPLLTPLRYLRIRHSAKWAYDFWVPLGLAVGLTVPAIFLPVNIFADKGFCYYILDLVKLLTGFYIASLGVVANLHREGLDLVMEGEHPPTLDNVKITRRQFLTALFGYLAFLSFVIYAVGTSAIIGTPVVRGLVPVALHPWMRGVFLMGFCLMVANLFISTVVGLHYMSHKVHVEEDAKRNAGKPEQGM